MSRAFAACSRTGRNAAIRRQRKPPVEALLNANESGGALPDSDFSTKKALILAVAQDIGKPRFTAAEIEQIRRQLIAQFGEHGKASSDYIASVLQEAGMRVVLSTRADTQGQYEEEFADLLHFSTLDEAEMCLVRLDELLRRFLRENELAAAERVREVARLGRRRAEMIARNQKVDAAKRAEKEEIARWFAVWLETPDAFFDWLEVRKQSPEFPEAVSSGNARG